MRKLIVALAIVFFAMLSIVFGQVLYRSSGGSTTLSLAVPALMWLLPWGLLTFAARGISRADVDRVRAFCFHVVAWLVTAFALSFSLLVIAAALKKSAYLGSLVILLGGLFVGTLFSFFHWLAWRPALRKEEEKTALLTSTTVSSVIGMTILYQGLIKIGTSHNINATNNIFIVVALMLLGISLTTSLTLYAFLPKRAL